MNRVWAYMSTLLPWGQRGILRSAVDLLPPHSTSRPWGWKPLRKARECVFPTCWVRAGRSRIGLGDGHRPTNRRQSKFPPPSAFKARLPGMCLARSSLVGVLVLVDPGRVLIEVRRRCACARPWPLGHHLGVPSTAQFVRKIEEARPCLVLLLHVRAVNSRVQLPAPLAAATTVVLLQRLLARPCGVVTARFGSKDLQGRCLRLAGGVSGPVLPCHASPQLLAHTGVRRSAASGRDRDALKVSCRSCRCQAAF